MPDEQSAGSSTAQEESPSATYRALEAQYSEGKAPVADPAPQDNSEPQAPTPDGKAASDSAKPKPRQKTPEDTDRRFKELLQERKELRERIERLEAATKPKEPVKEPEPLKRPVLEDFSQHGEKAWDMFEAAKEEYHEKKAELREAAAVKKALEAYDAKAIEAKAKEEFASIADKWNKALAAEREADEDFDMVAFNPDLHVTDDMMDYLLVSPVGTKVLRALGLDPDESKRISKLPHKLMTRELALIEAGLIEKPEKKTAAPAGKKLTAAPPPPSELGGRKGIGGSGDESMDALARGDFRAFDKAENEKAMRGIRH